MLRLIDVEAKRLHSFLALFLDNLNMADQDVCWGPLLLVSLPFDVLIEIFKWVPILDMLNLRRVSSHLTSKLANLTTESFLNDGTWALDMQIFRRVVA